MEAKYNIDIDPEDVRYNFFRWITSEAGFAMGPSRVDPRTGQILDADIIFDAGFLDSWKQKYETLTEEEARRLLPNWSLLDEQSAGIADGTPFDLAAHCAYGHEMQRHIAFAGAVLSVRGLTSADGGLPLKLVHEGIKEVVMHEVGHTLGLRHNFKASTWKSLEELDDVEKSKQEGTVASVMDYSPANIAPTTEEQGLYYTQTIGPYDYWAIEYAYKPIQGDEKAELAKIAARSGEPGLDYATDEDVETGDPDPYVNTFDLAKDPLAFIRRQMQHAEELIPSVVEKSVDEGEGYQRARQAFGLLVNEYWRAALLASRFPGGLSVNRDHKGAENARPPLAIIEPAVQREAMELIVASAFASPEYDGTLLNHLAATNWSHWGLQPNTRADYPVHRVIEQFQSLMLTELISATTFERILDNEYKTSADQDAYTLAEHLESLVAGVFTEWQAEQPAGQFTNRQPYINSMRRNLQRNALKRLANLVTGTAAVPPDARTLARFHLSNLSGNIERILAVEGLTLDDYTRAHLVDCRERIDQALSAELRVNSVN